MADRRLKIISIVLILILTFTILLFAKSQKSEESRFQLGLGLMVGSASLSGIIEDINLYKAIVNDKDYSYPGMTEEEEDAINNLNGTMQRAILIANILGGMEYAISLRILWEALISEVDIVLLPFDSYYNGRLDLELAPMIGLRAPFFIMPYIMAGITFTFSFYPDKLCNIENWRTRWAATDNFAFRPGVNVRAGLDLKFKSFSIGAFGQWTVKDVEEFTAWYSYLTSEGYTSSEATYKIFTSQCRVGAEIILYLF